jgi:hypothetical protein
MNQVTARGQLRHHFFGTYSATIILCFEDNKSAEDSLKVLGADWKLGEKHKMVLVWTGESEELEKIKDQLESFGAVRDKIDSIKYSIDYGEEFSVKIPVVCQEQISFI